MQNQDDLKCEGCGQKFNNRNDLQKHSSTCAALKAKAGSGQQPGQQQGQQQGQPFTHSAGGGQNPQR
jgi:hypothetical protein